MEPFKTIADIILRMDRQYGNHRALNHLENKAWRSFSSEDFLNAVKQLTLFLHSLNLGKGSCIGILAPCSAYWTIADFAIILSGNISVPLFANISHEHFDYEIRNSNIEVIFISGEEQLKVVKGFQPFFKKVISFKEHDHFLTLDAALKIGHSLEEQNPHLFDALLKKVKEDDLATIVYTSGSTGDPKGVELTHRSVSSLLHIDPFDWNPQNDRYLSILPLAHIFARSLNFIMIAWGISIYYLDDSKLFTEVASQIKPTICALVPRILEKIQSALHSHILSSIGFKKWIGIWAWSLAKAKPTSLLKKIFYPIADALVYEKFRQSLGGNFRVIISGGAHLNPEIYRFFLEIGFPVYEGYGLTEASTVSCNYPQHLKIGTVGHPFEGVLVATSSDNELLVKGGLVMNGYHRNPAATEEAFTTDGWLKTGDKARIDSEGYITILGRLKEMFKTSKGEYISPIPIEHLLTKDPLIDTAMVIGEDRAFPTCLLFPDLDKAKKIQAIWKMGDLSLEDFFKSPQVRLYLIKLLNSINHHLNQWERVRDYRIILSPPSIESGEFTPTMKLRREFIEKKYADLINSMYLEEAQ